MSTTFLDSEHSRVHLELVGRLKELKRSATFIIDGWDDDLHRSLYGSAAGRVGEPSIVLGLQDLTGERGNALKIQQAADTAMEEMLIEQAEAFLGLVTDNPNVMKAFRREFVTKYKWIIPLACWAHQNNTLVGEICRFPAAKSALQRANRVVTFFNSSHYWGGQLKLIAIAEKVTRGLKKNCESRWYAVILLASSVSSHQTPLGALIARPDARKMTNGLSPVNADVIRIVKDIEDNFWPWLSRTIRVARPFVDAIAETEGRGVNLADCMRSLLGAARRLSVLERDDDDDDEFEEFKKHAHAVVDKRFRQMATPVHRLAFFLHPLCRKVAVLDVDGYTLRDLKRTALEIAIEKWGWSEDEARKLSIDLGEYHGCRKPFAGAQRDSRAWWTDLPISTTEHPLKPFAKALLGLVPHSAEIERLFSSCNGIQSPKRNSLAVETFSKLAKIRSVLVEEARCRALPKSATQSSDVNTPPVSAEDDTSLQRPESLDKWEGPLEQDSESGEPRGGASGVDGAFIALEKELEEFDEANEAEGGAELDELDEELAAPTLAAVGKHRKSKAARQLSLMGGDLYNFALVKKALDNVVPQEVVQTVDVVRGKQSGTIDIDSLL
ncbi:ribonuclease H-like domain-containing protein [Mycena pura]|uniref:Ribonuclease H-like domain-containing protein n=1 Tax=Mycena pura TaxID=153505 RepID=A0AAD6YC17_9AGAR|nr:ribonuclease H-like domain-containing protein [Mycena pura]